MNKRNLCITLLPLIMLLPAIILGIGGIISEHTNILVWVCAWLLRLVLMLIFTIFIIVFFYRNVVKTRDVANKLKNVYLSYYSIVITLAVIELALTFHVQTVANPWSYSLRNWMILNWNPTNSTGYRDDEFVKRKEKLAVFIGDSFTAGFGISDYQDRTSNIVENESDYSTFNMGVNGLSTSDVPEIITQIQTDVDIVFVQYYINDIEGAAQAHDHNFKPRVYNGLFKFSIYSSYIWNTIATRYFSLDNPAIGYTEFIEQNVNDSKVWETHMSEVIKIKQLVMDKDASLVFIVYPFLKNPALTDFYINKLVLELKNERIDFIDVRKLIDKSNMPVKSRMVNKYDDHPSKLLNRVVASEIIKTYL